jgi:hypothetical protein
MDMNTQQDVRERKGSFFTPQIWVELSQKYIADVLGKDWQDEYYVWDCAAGTGNLLAGLTNKYNLWASTLDKQDVDVMHDRINTMNKNSITGEGANLLHDHVFQFDFLNDDFDKLPKPLKKIINDEGKRKKLIIYINPPYAEASNRQTIGSKGENKSNVSTETKIYKDFSPIVGTATRELFAQFFLRIYRNIPNAIFASFSTLKYINSQYFIKFRDYFEAEFKKGFVVPSKTFDNVNGQFPIGFLIWNLNNKKGIEQISCDVFDNNSKNIGTKSFFSGKKNEFIIDWLRKFYDKQSEPIAFLRMQGTDMQNNLGVFITNNLSKNDIIKHLFTTITKENLIGMSIYYTVRKCIGSTWLNDRDQFLYPNNGWETDLDFQNDCLAYTLFSNNIQSKYGVNNWIPFTEQEVDSREKFESRFMTDFIAGKIKKEKRLDLFDKKSNPIVEKQKKLEFSIEAQSVFDAGKALWKYYHQQENCNVNASLYDIREHFQGRNEKGKMNNGSENETYMNLITDIREKLRILAKKIEPKVYEYGFLKK